MPKLYQSWYPYLRRIRPVRSAFIGGLAASVIYGVTSGFGLPFMSQKILPLVFGETPPSTLRLALVVAYLPALFLIRNAAYFLSEYLTQYCGVKIMEELQRELFAKLQRLPIAFYEKWTKGDLMSRVQQDANQVQLGITRVTNSLVRDPVTFLGALGALLYLAWRNHDLIYVLLSLMVLPICVLPVRYVGKKLYNRAVRMQQEMGAVTDVLSENLSAAVEVRAFNLEDQQTAKFVGCLRILFRFQLKVVAYGRALTPLIEFISAVGVSLAIFYAAQARVRLDEVATLVFALYMSYEPLKSMGRTHNDLQQATASIERLEAILTEPETITDRPGAKSLERARGEIVFRDVSFQYGTAPVLRGVSCTLQAGQAYALVGPSGAGKSTFIKLVPRFYDVTSGQVCLDGIDLRDLKLHDLREQIALVSQHPVLFNDTIRQNIAIGRPGATEEEICQAAELAHAHSFIQSFDKGYETMVGDSGSRLSGGQRQRIALARAFLKNAPVLILDEATSSLDAESEELVQDAVQRLMKGRTVLLIAHRFSSIRYVDRILVLEDGRLAAEGPHEDLLRESPLYKRLWEKQFADSI